jgi:hypothetical protein
LAIRVPLLLDTLMMMIEMASRFVTPSGASQN